LRDCEFFDSEKAATDADAKRPAGEAAALDQASGQAAADAEAKRLADEAAALDESTRQTAAITGGPDTQPAKPDQMLLPATLNDTFRGIIHRTGKRCNAITDHVWVTPEHISIMCDRRLRAAFIREGDGWRLARPEE
jgi:hypothetical protein